MVTRKYLGIGLLFIFVICILNNPSNSSADAWLPVAGSYQYISIFSMIDKGSKNNKNKRSSAFIKIRDEVDALYSLRSFIKKEANNENRNLRNSEIRALENITNDIAKLEDISEMLASFRDEYYAQSLIEYGATDNQSFGIKFNYIIDKFAGYNDPNHNKEFIGKDADFFYKYRLFKNKKWSASIKPTVQFSSYDNKNSCKFMDLAIYAGYSKQKKNGTNIFHEFGVSIRKYFNNALGDKIGYTTSVMDGLKFKNGIMLTNFTQYEKTKLRNLVYSQTIYEQISIAKEFSVNKLIKHNFTAQIGYFWKSSMVDKTFRMSGPIISIWLSV